MDLLSIQGARLNNTLHWILPQHNQVLHLKSHQYHMWHLNPYRRQVRSSSSTAENWPLLQVDLYTFIQWKSTSTWNRPLHSCQRTTIQTCHRFRSEVSCSCHPQILEVHSSSGSPWQVRTSRRYTYLLLDEVPILLEGNEQRHSEIHSQLHTMPLRKGQNSKLPPSDDRYSWQTIGQNCNRPSYWMWNINIWK